MGKSGLSISRNKRVRFVILGGGSVTVEYYLPALQLTGRLADAVVVDPDAEQLRSLEPNFQVVRICPESYISFLDRLAAPTDDAEECIIVALPNHLHVDAVSRALKKDRHVLCEKPLALSTRDCAVLKDLATSRQRLLKVAMSRRYLASLRLAREMVQSKELGDVVAITVHDRMPFMWRPRSFSFFSRDAGGVLADMGVHYLDYIITLLGPLTPIHYEDDALGGNESSCIFRLKGIDGTPVNLSLSRTQQTGSWLTLSCRRGEIRIDKSSENALTVTPIGCPSRRVVVEQPFSEHFWPSDFHGSFAEMLRDMEAELSGKHTNIADVADSEHTVGLIEWAYNSRQTTASSRSVTRGARPAVVTGGTGFIGGHLIERLTATGVEVRVSARSPSKCANIARFPIDLRPTDLLDPASVAQAVDGAGVVYHLAYGNDGTHPARITIEGTQNVVEAAIAAQVDCVVILSTMYVFGFPRTEQPVDETFPYAPYGGEYGRSKAKIERWCLERARTSGGTRIVVLNPTCVFGPAGGAYTTLPVDLAKSSSFCWIENGNGSANFIYVQNLIDAILLAASNPAAHGERFILNDGTVTWRELLEPFVAPLGAPIPSYTVEELALLPRYGGRFRMTDLLKAAVSATEVRTIAKRSAIVRQGFALANRLWPRPPMTGDSLTTLAHPVETTGKTVPPLWLAELCGPQWTLFSADKAKRVLGWSPRVSLNSAQAATLAWLVDNGRLPEMNV